MSDELHSIQERITKTDLVSLALGQRLCWRPCKLCNQARVCCVSVYESGITPV
jgi:hypothetical protein